MAAVLHRMTGAKEASYDPANYCIYCGDRKDPESLRDEHIVPYALNGNRVLPKSSCSDCERAINSGFESRVLGTNFSVPRAQLGFQTRNKRKRPRTVEAGLFCDDSKVHSDVQIDKLPILILEPEYRPPGFLLGNEPVEGSGIELRGMRLFGSDLDRAKQHGIAYQDVSTNPLKFGRFLAKIAHGVLVAENRDLEIEFLLPSIVLGTSTAIGHYVGNENICLRQENPEAKSGLHMIKTDWREDIAVILIRLFLNFEMSLTYSVVAGRKNGPRK